MSNKIMVNRAATKLVKLKKVGPPGPPGADGGGGLWGTITGDILNQIDLQTQFGKMVLANGGTLINFNEDSEALVFTAGAAALNVNTCKNKQFMTLTQEGFITTSGTPVVGKPILLTITHSGSAWPLSWNATALTILVGAVGETERVLAQWDGAAWGFDSIGLFDQVI